MALVCRAQEDMHVLEEDPVLGWICRYLDTQSYNQTGYSEHVTGFALSLVRVAVSRIQKPQNSTD